MQFGQWIETVFCAGIDEVPFGLETGRLCQRQHIQLVWCMSLSKSKRIVQGPVVGGAAPKFQCRELALEE
jgi:hypothetical protein